MKWKSFKGCKKALPRKVCSKFKCYSESITITAPILRCILRCDVEALKNSSMVKIELVVKILTERQQTF